MLSTNQEPEQLISSGTQVIGRYADDSIVRPKHRKSVAGVRPGAGPPRNNSSAQRNSAASDQDLIDQAFADYWTL
jgi:hypothetical protein